MNKNKIRIGVMGCANIAKRSVIPAIKSINEFELVAVASRSINKAKEFAKLFDCDGIVGYENLLEDKNIDVIYIPLPTGLHEEWVSKALIAGKHVFVEKSFALNYQSTQKLINIAKERQLLIMENFMFLYHKQHQFVQNLIDEGEIGQIRCFRSSFGFPPLDPKNFRYSKNLGGGALLDAAAYTIKASQLFLGADLKVEAATLNYDNAEVDIHGGAFLKTPKGLFSEIAFGFDNYYQCNYEIWGSKGKIIAQKAFTPGFNQKPTIILESSNGIERHEIEAENHFISILLELKKCLEEKCYTAKYNEILDQSRLIEELLNKSIAV